MTDWKRQHRAGGWLAETRSAHRRDRQSDGERSHKFKLTDAARLVRATTSAGLTIKNVFLTEEGLRVEVDNTASPAAAPAADKNPLDRILDHAEDPQRTS
jgi:hypothetical protein